MSMEANEEQGCSHTERGRKKKIGPAKQADERKTEEFSKRSDRGGTGFIRTRRKPVRRLTKLNFIGNSNRLVYF